MSGLLMMINQHVLAEIQIGLKVVSKYRKRHMLK